jgi:hypothetical protein
MMNLDEPMPLTCAALKTLNQPELFVFRPRLWALAKTVLSGRRPWWQTPEQTRSEVKIGGIGRFLLLLAPLHPRRLLMREWTPSRLDQKIARPETGVQIRQGSDQT